MYRPSMHFTPEYGWMNDPNGAVFYAGKYHLFYQHNPHGLTWDHMHWGHAVSDDLLSWEHLPIALFPDEMGDIFSGSCLVDTENISGFSPDAKAPLLAFYTSHDMATKREQQCLAYSLDGVTFTKFEGNPIIPGKENTPARDPHVFRNKVIGGFSMCITTEKAIEFYHSTDLRNWEKTGEFTLPDFAFSGMIECPCLIELKVENEDASGYVLMMSMDIPEKEYWKFPQEAVPHSRLMQYFTGAFDGETFICDSKMRRPLLVDYGLDFYAGTVFANCEDAILIAWLGNSKESMLIPTEKEGFRGIQSCPRKLSLVKAGDVYLLRQQFFPKVEACPDVKLLSVPGGICLLDHCVREELLKDGLISKTACAWQA